MLLVVRELMLELTLVPLASLHIARSSLHVARSSLHRVGRVVSVLLYCGGTDTSAIRYASAYLIQVLSPPTRTPLRDFDGRRGIRQVSRPGDLAGVPNGACSRGAARIL